MHRASFRISVRAHVSLEGLYYSIEDYSVTQNYLNPLLKEEQSSHSNKRLLEYERFSYKLLKHCVEELTSGSASLTVETVLKVSNLCVGSLEKCARRTSKQKSLHFERLLLHLADGCRVAGDISECVKACRHLQGRLSSNIPEEAVLLQQTLEVLWLASPLRRLPPPTYRSDRLICGNYI